MSGHRDEGLRDFFTQPAGLLWTPRPTQPPPPLPKWVKAQTLQGGLAFGVSPQVTFRYYRVLSHGPYHLCQLKEWEGPNFDEHAEVKFLA